MTHGPVLVVGTGRSGTSVVARLLQEDLGIDMGGPGNTERESNPGGDYEAQEFKRLDHQLRRGRITRTRFVGEVRRAGARRTPPWGAKHPANAVHLDAWLEAFPEAVVVWAQRDHADTVASWRRWYGTDPDVAWRVVRRRHRAIGEALKGWSGPRLVLDLTEKVQEEALAALLQVFLQRWSVIPTPP